MGQRIVMVVVIFGRPPAEAETIQSICNVFGNDPELAESFALLIYDNSPVAHSCTIDSCFPVLYRHDPGNPGLAAAYNFGLGIAERDGCTWLLLLDQDSSPTREFFHEVRECTAQLASKSDVASIVPKLIVNGRVYSPEASLIYQLRHQYPRSNHSVKRDVLGVQTERLSAYNSCATLRVSALRSIGGFPTKFWLDYLDHATFHRLAAQGYSMYVMRSEVEHGVSHADLSAVPPWRQRNILRAQTLFVREVGNFLDRLLYRIWIVRYSRSLWIHHPDRSLWKDAALQIFKMETRAERPLRPDSSKSR